jgi:hypothetical protein
MPPVDPTTLRGALIVLGQDHSEWLDKVDQRLGNVVTGTELRRSMHGIFGWILPGSEAPHLVREARQRAIERLPSLPRGQARTDLVASVHTATVALTFFDHVSKLLADVPSLEPPSVHMWHQEDHSFVSYLYSDDLPMPFAARTFEAHLKDVTRWAADRGERVRRALPQTEPVTTADALLSFQFAEAVTTRYVANFSALAHVVPEFVVWADLADADVAERARRWLSSNRQEPPADDRLGTLRRANLTVLAQPLAGEAHVPIVEQLYVGPNFRVAEAGPSARLTSDDWWSSEIGLRQDLELMLAGHLSNPWSTRTNHGDLNHVFISLSCRVSVTSDKYMNMNNK